MIERFFLTLKQDCVSLHHFESCDHAFRIVGDWLERYDRERPTRPSAISHRASSGSD